MKRNQAHLEAVGRAAFWGGNPHAADFIARALSYEMDGQTHPANGYSLAQAIETMKTISEKDFFELDALGLLYPYPTDTTEQGQGIAEFIIITAAITAALYIIGQVAQTFALHIIP